MSERWARLRELVEEGAALPAGERDAWLDSACGGDASLRDEARKIIESSLDDEQFLEPPRPAPPLAPGIRLNGYRLDRVIASGGMGTVFLAHQVEPERSVAVKVMRHGLFNDAAAARFRYEVRVLAALQHPNIASMYHTGVYPDGAGNELPWFAMEFVAKAQPFTKWAHGRAPAEVVRRFADVCDAVDHGHRKGVVHRDLKPDNILVDADGRPKVIDFGIARATDSDISLTTHRTSAGEILGTLAYMSPEQIVGDLAALGTRSDIYSLGVVLYEALTATLPYDTKGKSFVDLAGTIQSTPPRRMPALSGDLETIVFKCLRKDPDDRYASAASLADDLRRYLAREPIEAHPPSVSYQVRMFARRHRALVTAGVLVVLVSIAAAVISAGYAVDARRSESTALRKKTEADEARQAADRARDRANTLVNALTDRSIASISNFLPRLADLPGGPKVARALLQKTLDDLEKLDAMSPDNPDVRRALAIAHVRIGDIEGNPTLPNLGNEKEAMTRYEKALAIMRPLRKQYPENESVVYDLATVLGQLAMMAMKGRDLEAARTLLQEKYDLLSAQCERRPGRDNSWGSLASTHMQLGTLARREGDHAEYRRHTERRRDIFEKLLAQDSGNASARLHLSQAYVGLASPHYQAKEFAAAIALYDRAEPHLRKLLEEEPERITYRAKLAFTLFLAAQCHGQTKNFGAGLRRMREAHDLYKELARQNYRDPNQADLLGISGFLVGEFHYDIGRRSEGATRREHLESAVASFRKALDHFAGKQDPTAARTIANAKRRIATCERALNG